MAEVTVDDWLEDLVDVRIEAKTPPLVPAGFATPDETLAALHTGEVTSASNTEAMPVESDDLTKETLLALTDPDAAEKTLAVTPPPPTDPTSIADLTMIKLFEKPATTEPTAGPSTAPTSTLEPTMVRVFRDTTPKPKAASPDNSGSTIECIDLSGSPVVGSPTSSGSCVNIGTSSDEDVVKFDAVVNL